MSPSRSAVDTPAQRRNRFIIIALCLAGMLAIAALEVAAYHRSHPSPARHVPMALLNARLEQFGHGKLVSQGFTEGDYARGGYVGAQMDQVTTPAQCKSKIRFYTQGCLQWLQDAASLKSPEPPKQR